MTLADVTLVLTGWQRPGYLGQAVASWASCPQVRELRQVVLALGPSPVANVMQAVVRQAFPQAETWMDRCPPAGEHRPLGEAIGRVFASDPGASFVIASSEDVVVSDDVLAYMQWARELKQVRPLCVCAGNELGQGWHTWHDDSDASQTAVSVRPGFNPLCWGTWRDQWEQHISASWDYDCNTGTSGHDNGWDWQMWRLARDRGALMPAASRSLNIGRHGGRYGTEATFTASQARSFRAHREPRYELVS